MEKISPPWTLGQLSKILDAELVGDADFVVLRPVPAHSNDPHGIAFAESEKYIEAALASGVGALIIPPTVAGILLPHLKHPRPRLAFGVLLHMNNKPLKLEPGIHESAIVHPSAKIHASAKVGAYCVVAAEAVVEENASLFPFCYIGERCIVGANSTFMPRVTLVQDVSVWSGCIIHSGAVLGSDGFGFVWDGMSRVKIPQTGSVIIGKNVEIGANSCVDRATCGETTVGDGTKVDNLVQIAHNVQMGADGILCSLSALAGSSVLGDRSVMGGQSALRDHVTVTDDVILAGRTGVMSNISKPGEYFGLPATPIKESMRQMASIRRLPDLLDRVRKLEKRIQELEK